MVTNLKVLRDNSILDKESFRDDLKTIATIRVSLASLRAREVHNVEIIKITEMDLRDIRADINHLENKIMERCDKLFNEVYEQLPDEETPHAD